MRTINSISWVLLLAVGALTTGCEKGRSSAVSNCALSVSGSEDTTYSTQTNNLANTDLAQSFTPIQSVSVSNAVLRLARQGTPTGTVTVSIQSDAAGVPSGANLLSASQNLVDTGVNLLSTSPQSVTFSFSASVTLAAGTLYWVRLSSSHVANSLVNVIWASSSASIYANGRAFFQNVGVFTPFTFPDRDFMVGVGCNS